MLRDIVVFVVGCLIPCFAASYTDTKCGAIYDKITFPLMLAGLVHSLDAGIWRSALCGALFAGVAFGACVLARGMGGGDLKLGVGLGLWFGFPGVVWVILIGSLLAFAFGVLRKAVRGECKAWLLCLVRGIALRVAGVRGGLALGSIDDPHADVLPFGAFFSAGAVIVFAARLVCSTVVLS